MKYGMVSKRLPAFVLVSVVLWVGFADATKLQPPRFGRVKVALRDSLRSSDPPTLDMTVWAGKDVENASVTMTIHDLATNKRSSEDVWNGRVIVGDSFTVSHTLGQYPSGAYWIILHLNLSAEWGGGHSDQFYVEVDENGWLASRESPSARLLRAIDVELKARGLHGLSSGKLREVAPDLARQLDSLGVGIPPTKEEIEESHRAVEIRRANKRAADSARRVNGIPIEVKPQPPDSADDDRSYPYYEIIDGDSVVYTGKHSRVTYPANADSLLQEKLRRKMNHGP